MKDNKPIMIPIVNPGFKQSKELMQWIEDNQDKLLQYPNQYLLIILPKGIVAAAETQDLLYKKIYQMSQQMEQFTEEELKQPTYIINTVIAGINADRSKWGQA